MLQEEMIGALLRILRVSELSSQIVRQIDKFQTQGITNKQIARSVCYFFEEKGNDLQSINTYGIGFVPLVYKEADDFYNTIIRKQEKLKQQAAQYKENLKTLEVQTVETQDRILRKRGYDINEWNQ